MFVCLLSVLSLVFNIAPLPVLNMLIPQIPLFFQKSPPPRFNCLVIKIVFFFPHFFYIFFMDCNLMIELNLITLKIVIIKKHWSN